MADETAAPIIITPDEVKAVLDYAFSELEKLESGRPLVVSVLKWANAAIDASAIPKLVADYINHLLGKKGVKAP